MLIKNITNSPNQWQMKSLGIYFNIYIMLTRQFQNKWPYNNQFSVFVLIFTSYDLKHKHKYITSCIAPNGLIKLESRRFTSEYFLSIYEINYLNICFIFFSGNVSLSWFTRRM